MSTDKGETFEANHARLAPLLAGLKRDGIGHVIAGKRVDSKATFEAHSPVDRSLIAKVARGTADDIDRAAVAAKGAFKAWAAWEPAKRRALMHRIADKIVQHADDIAVLESWDTGQPHRFMSKAAVRSAENFRFFADRVPSARDGVNLPTAEHWNITTRVPIGPVGIITPWHTPFMVSTKRSPEVMSTAPFSSSWKLATKRELTSPTYSVFSSGESTMPFGERGPPGALSAVKGPVRSPVGDKR